MMKNLIQIAAATLVLVSSGVAHAAELILLEQKGCAWCARWDAEIAPVYPNTAESQIAPLRRVDIHEPWPDDLANVKKDVFTPTFVLVENGKEIARLRGYTGDEFFWFLLNEMLDELPDQPET